MPVFSQSNPPKILQCAYPIEGHGFLLVWRVYTIHKALLATRYVKTTLPQVFYQTFWMKAYGSATPKRTIVYSNTSHVKMLDCGQLTRAQLASTVRTTKQYVSKAGRKRFAGNANLKGTQFLVWSVMFWIWPHPVTAVYGNSKTSIHEFFFKYISGSTLFYVYL